MLLGDLESLRLAVKKDDTSDKTRRAIEREAMVALAGSIAELLHDGESDTEHTGNADRESAIKLLDRLSGSFEEAVAYANWLGERATNIVRLHWGAVEALSQALLLMGEVAGSAARKLAAEHLYESRDDDPSSTEKHDDRTT